MTPPRARARARGDRPTDVSSPGYLATMRTRRRVHRASYRDRDVDDSVGRFARCVTGFQLTCAADAEAAGVMSAALGQSWNANAETCVRQLNPPSCGMYSVV